MNRLLEFLMAHFSYLYDELGCKFVDSQVHSANAVLVFQLNDLRLRLVRDRSQVFMDFQNKGRTSQDRWYSFGVVRQLITGETGSSEELDAEKAAFIRDHFPRIVELFSNANSRRTAKTLEAFEHARGKRLFG